MKPTIKTLCFREAVASDQPTTVQLLVRLEAPTATSGQRPSLNVGLALDRSTSMQGQPIEHLRQASLYLVSSLAPDDMVSAISFDSQLETLAPARPAAEQHRLREMLLFLDVRGSTNLYGGLELAASEVHKAKGKRQLDRQIVLTDGHPTAGIVDSERLIACVKKWKTLGVTTTAIGLGAHYNEDLLAELADAGGGNFYHLEHSQDIAAFFQLELNGLARTFAREVSLKIESLGDVEILRVFNTLKKGPGGSLVLGDLVRGMPTDLALEIQVPPMPTPAQLLRFHLTYVDLETGVEQTVEAALELPVVPFGQLVEFPVNNEVTQQRALQLAAHGIDEAIRHLDRNAQDEAKKILKEALRVLGETESSPEIDTISERIKGMLANIDTQRVALARKDAKYTSVSYSKSSMGSLSLYFLKSYMELPESERTPERLRKIIEEHG